MAIAVAALALSFLLSYLLTPVIGRLATRYDFVDRPDGRRKMQSNPVSLGGGLVLLIATSSVVALTAWWWGPDLLWIATRPNSLMGLAFAVGLLAVVGIIDDRFGVRGSLKLFWQVVAASMILGTGLTIPRILFPGIDLSLGWLGSLFTIGWILGAINSFNLIDGVDGLAGSVGVVFSLTFGAIALMGCHYIDAVICFALAGSLLGFLRFNFPPAKIYLGDTGSMLIGLVLGTIALRCSMKQAATLAFAAPLAIWSIPMFDSLAAIMRRKLTGRSIYATDRGHIHHVLLTRGLSAGQAVAFISGLCAITSIGAVVSWRYEQDWLGVVVVLGVIGMLVATRVFGHVEFLLLNTRLFGFGRLVRLGDRGGGNPNVRHTSLNLQGTRQWEELWGALVASAERFHVVKMKLNLALPRLHEDFYATWRHKGNFRRELLWQADIPLVVDGLPVGRLNVVGVQSEQFASTEMSHFIDFVEGLEGELRQLIQTDLQRLDDRQAGQPIADTEPSDAEPSARLPKTATASS